MRSRSEHPSSRKRCAECIGAQAWPNWILHDHGRAFVLRCRSGVRSVRWMPDPLASIAGARRPSAGRSTVWLRSGPSQSRPAGRLLSDDSQWWSCRMCGAMSGPGLQRTQTRYTWQQYADGRRVAAGSSSRCGHAVIGGALPGHDHWPSSATAYPERIAGLVIDQPWRTSRTTRPGGRGRFHGVPPRAGAHVRSGSGMAAESPQSSRDRRAMVREAIEGA